MSSPFGESPFKAGYAAGPSAGSPPSGPFPPPSPPPRHSLGGVLAVVAVAVLGTMFMCCCGVPTALFRRSGRLHQHHEYYVPMPQGLLDQNEDPYRHLDEFNRQNEEEMNDFRRRNNEWLRSVERDREETLRRMHRYLDEF